MTKIWPRVATTDGQNIGIEADIIAKSISRHDMIRIWGYHQGKLVVCSRVVLCFKKPHMRRIAIRMTLQKSTVFFEMIVLKYSH